MKRTISTLGFATVLLLAGCGGMQTYDGVPETWSQAQSMVLAQLEIARPGLQLIMPYSDIFPGVYVTFAIPQKDGGYILVRNEELEAWGITKATLQERALANLEKIAKNSDVQKLAVSGRPDERYLIAETGDGFSAARILTETIRNTAKEFLGEPYVVGIPTRDFLIIWPEDISIAGKFAEQVQMEFQADSDFPISPNIYRFSGNTIEVGSPAKEEE